MELYLAAWMVWKWAAKMVHMMVERMAHTKAVRKDRQLADLKDESTVALSVVLMVML